MPRCQLHGAGTSLGKPQLTYTHKPGVGIEVDVNGTVKGMVEGDDFAKAFLAIWLGAKPPNPNLKAGLLGGACG